MGMRPCFKPASLLLRGLMFATAFVLATCDDASSPGRVGMHSMSAGEADTLFDSGWKRSSIESTRPPDYPFALKLAAAGQAGFVAFAVGGIGCCWNSVMGWRSSDGREWERIANDVKLFAPRFPPGRGAQRRQPSALTAWQSGFVAVGSEDFDGNTKPVVWNTSDGLRWRRISLSSGTATMAWMDGVAVAAEDLVAVGTRWFDESHSDGAVWWSRDARTWHRVRDKQHTFAGSELAGVVAGGPGFVAFGVFSSAGHHQVGIWSSPDGSVWTRTTNGDVTFRDATITRMIARGPGLVAIGLRDLGPSKIFNRLRTVAGIWVSSDGRGWQRVSDPGALGKRAGERVNAAVAAGPWLVAVGSERHGAPGLWSSRDGRHWQRANDSEGAFGRSTYGEVELNDIVTAGETLLVAGGVPIEPGNKARYAASVWAWPSSRHEP
jgi:hypothetical protein